MEAWESLIEGDYKNFLIEAVGGFLPFVIISLLVIGTLSYVVWVYSKNYSITLSFLIIMLSVWNLYFGVIPSPYAIPIYILFALYLTFAIAKALR